MAEGEIFVAGWRQIRGGRSAGRCATVPRRLLPTSAPSVLQNLVVVDPDRLDVARFFAYGPLGADRDGFYSSDDLLWRRLAANGVRLVLEEFRTTETPTLKAGKAGKTRVTYGEVDDAVAWLWKFVDGARSAGELYRRTRAVFAAQHYAKQVVPAASKRRPSALPASYGEWARKAFERVYRSAVPDTHKQLDRAIAREAREHAKRQRERHEAQRPQETDQPQDANRAGAARGGSVQIVAPGHVDPTSGRRAGCQEVRSQR